MSTVRPEISRPSATLTEPRALGIAAFEYNLPIQDKLARVAQLGADCCELAVPGDVTLRNAAAVGEALAASGVRVTALASLSKPNSPGQAESGIQLLDASIRCAEALGAPYAIAYFGGHPDRPTAEAIERYRELVRPSIELAAELGVSILIENHFSHAPGDVTSSPHGCAELIAAINAENFALNLDPCNFAIAGVDVVAAYAELRDVVRNVHVKDARPYDPVRDADYSGRVVADLNRGEFLFVPAGEGIADNASVLQALLNAGNAVPVTVEAHTPVETLDEVFAQGLSYCRNQGL